MSNDSFRVGLGTDVHRLEAGDGILLGGAAIPCDKRCIAVSDGDVVLHALVDALLGACAGGDIGDHFPASAVAPGETSRRFVEFALDALASRGASIVNVDCVIDLEAVRLAPFKERIRDSLSGILGISPDRIGVKAKTAEGMGPVGAGEAVAAQAIVLLRVDGDRDES